MNLKGSLHDFWHIIPLPWMGHNGAHCTNGMYILSNCVCISVLGDKKHKLCLSIFYAKLNFRDFFCKSCLLVLPACHLIWLGQSLRSGIWFSFFLSTYSKGKYMHLLLPTGEDEWGEEDGTTLKGDTLACSQGFVDIKIKVVY